MVKDCDNFNGPSADLGRCGTLWRRFERGQTPACSLCIFLAIVDRRREMLNVRISASASLISPLKIVFDTLRLMRNRIRRSGLMGSHSFKMLTTSSAAQMSKGDGWMGTTTKSLATMAERAILFTLGGPSITIHS